MIFVSKNWSNDFIIDYKPSSNLVKMIENKLHFEEELKKFEGFFWMGWTCEHIKCSKKNQYFFIFVIKKN